MSGALWLQLDEAFFSEEKVNQKGLRIFEEDKPELHLEIHQIGSKENTILSLENAFILGNALLEWVEHIKGKEWIGSVETVFEGGFPPYLRKKGD